MRRIVDANHIACAIVARQCAVVGAVEEDAEICPLVCNDSGHHVCGADGVGLVVLLDDEMIGSFSVWGPEPLLSVRNEGVSSNAKRNMLVSNLTR